VTKRFGVNQQQWLDPDFGTHKYSEIQTAFRIVVTPGTLKGKIWEFFLLLPGCEKVDLHEIITHAVEGVIDDGDHYRVMEIDEEDVKKIVDTTPMLISHPMDDMSFFWIMPPRHLRS